MPSGGCMDMSYLDAIVLDYQGGDPPPSPARYCYHSLRSQEPNPPSYTSCSGTHSWNQGLLIFYPYLILLVGEKSNVSLRCARCSLSFIPGRTLLINIIRHLVLRTPYSVDSSHSRITFSGHIPYPSNRTIHSSISGQRPRKVDR